GAWGVAVSAWLRSRPTAVSHHSPLTVSRPRTVSPRSVKNAIAASRSRTATATFSRRMGMSPRYAAASPNGSHVVDHLLVRVPPADAVADELAWSVGGVQDLERGREPGPRDASGQGDVRRPHRVALLGHAGADPGDRLGQLPVRFDQQRE